MSRIFISHGHMAVHKQNFFSSLIPKTTVVVEMSTLPFWLGSCIPRKLSTFIPSSPIINNLISTSEEASSTKYSSAQQHKTSSPPALLNPILLKRREAVIGVGISSGLVGVLLSQSQLLPAVKAAEATPSPCELTVAPSGLAYCDEMVGTGTGAVKGQLIKAHYVGKLENGKVFDSSYSRGKPITFRIGVGEVIIGWDEGILGGDGVPPMLPGGKRSLKLPPALGYGIRGAGCRGGSCIIPPDSVLLFDVEFIGPA
ncbi:peptidylprolyl isomerase [Sarracenia purpurea var. burkii]